MKAGNDSLKDGERLLLWHGSRTTNFAGILKQGLRIAPPEGVSTSIAKSFSTDLSRYQLLSPVCHDSLFP